MDTLTTKQFGDACEHLVLAELMLAGWPAHKMPDGWPGYDLAASSPNGETIRISVKGLRAGYGKLASFYRFELNGCDWLALVRVNTETSTRQFFLLPRDAALVLSLAENDGRRRINYKNSGLATYEGIAALKPSAEI
jgi:hypothetical protein